MIAPQTSLLLNFAGCWETNTSLDGHTVVAILPSKRLIPDILKQWSARKILGTGMDHSGKERLLPVNYSRTWGKAKAILPM